MADTETARRALQPEDLGRLFLERASAGDVDGVVALYEPGAVLAFPPGHLAIRVLVARPARHGRDGLDVPHRGRSAYSRCRL